MPKNEKIDQAKKLYESGKRLVDIARELEVPDGTVRRWKSIYKWDNEESERSVQKKANVRKKKEVRVRRKNRKSDIIPDDISENTELTEKQMLFCIYYVKYFNATKAYQKAYECEYKTAITNASRLLTNANIKSEIQKLKKDRISRELISEDDIFQKYIDIAFADITDFVEFRTEEVPVMAVYGPVKVKNENTGKEEILKKTVNVVRFKDSNTVDGSIINEVKQGRDGASIKLSDRMKALEWLTAHMDIATEEQKAKIALMKAKVMNDADEITADDGFLEALNGTAAEDWADEED